MVKDHSRPSMLLTCSSYEDMFGILCIVSPVEGATSAVNERTLVFPPRSMSMIMTARTKRISIILFIIERLLWPLSPYHISHQFLSKISKYFKSSKIMSVSTFESPNS